MDINLRRKTQESVFFYRYGTKYYLIKGVVI